MSISGDLDGGGQRTVSLHKGILYPDGLKEGLPLVDLVLFHSIVIGGSNQGM